jgi:hypothetical protein
LAGLIVVFGLSVILVNILLPEIENLILTIVTSVGLIALVGLYWIPIPAIICGIVAKKKQRDVFGWILLSLAFGFWTIFFVDYAKPKRVPLVLSDVDAHRANGTARTKSLFLALKKDPVVVAVIMTAIVVFVVAFFL